jgi:HEAT repeat protein
MIPDSDVETLVQGLFSPDRADECYETLKALAPRAVPYLVAAMKDPRVPAGGATAYGLPDFQSPLFRISDLLAESDSPDAAAPFLNLLTHPDVRLRKHGASYLAELAQPNCIEAVTRLLASDDRDLRLYTMFGIGHALKARRGAPRFFQAIRPHLIPLLQVDDIHGMAPKLIAQIDAVSAAPILVDPKQLSPDNPNLLQALEVLNESRIPIPLELLLPLIDQLGSLVDQPESLAVKYVLGYQLAAALFAYARNPDVRTEPRLRTFLQSPSEPVQTGAATALAALHGVEGHYTKLLHLVDEQGIDALTDAERNYYTASIYYWEIQNGGPWQYVGNSTANHHTQIVAGLRAIGAAQTAQALEELGRVFGPSGPSANRGERNDQADAFTPHQVAAVDQLYAPFPSPGENVEMLLDLYTATHAGDFPHCR